MMKAIFWILLLANLTFFAAMQWGGELLAVGDQTMQAQPALHEDKIRLLNAPHSASSVASSASAAVAASAGTPATVAESLPSATGSDAPVCMEWGDFSGTDLTRATAALSALQLGDKLSQHQIEHNIGYWVYIPPLKGKATVAQKIAQLKARGIEEYFVVSDAGPWLNAISLGVFKTQDAAQGFLDDLQNTRDVRTAKVGERASKLRTTVFVLNEPDAATVAALTRMQKDFSGSTLKHIPCANIDKAG